MWWSLHAFKQTLYAVLTVMRTWSDLDQTQLLEQLNQLPQLSAQSRFIVEMHNLNKVVDTSNVKYDDQAYNHFSLHCEIAST